MKPVGLIDPRTGRSPTRPCSCGRTTSRAITTAWSDFRRRSMGRTGARAADDSRPRAGRVRALRHGPPQHLYQRTDGAAGDVADARASDLFFAGQMSGVEGYVESAASGLLAGRNAAALVRGQALRTAADDRDRRARVLRLARRPADYQPTNITFGIMEPPPGAVPTS